jgi:hypothetical protein
VRDGEIYFSAVGPSAEETGVAGNPDALSEDRRGESAQERICALEGCEKPVPPKKRPGGSPQQFCSERCQRTDEKRRFRARHRKMATCRRDGCGRVFERAATSERKQVYCTVECQALARSVEYRERPDILENAACARRFGREAA